MTTFLFLLCGNIVGIFVYILWSDVFRWLILCWGLYDFFVILTIYPHFDLYHISQSNTIVSNVFIRLKHWRDYYEGHELITRFPDACVPLENGDYMQIYNGFTSEFYKVALCYYKSDFGHEEYTLNLHKLTDDSVLYSEKSLDFISSIDFLSMHYKRKVKKFGLFSTSSVNANGNCRKKTELPCGIVKLYIELSYLFGIAS